MIPRVAIVAMVISGCGLRFGAPSAAALPSRFPSSDGQTPYASTVNWFGYIANEAPAPPEGEAPRRYLYVWLPNAAPEVGVRVVSPVAGWTTPEADDYQSPDFAAHAEALTGFDPAVSLERCVNAMNPEDLLVPCEYWSALGENDDSTELPPPVGTEVKTNALMRTVSNPDEALEALIRGLYRVGISAGKGGELAGPYWLQVGAARDYSEKILIATTPGELASQIP